MKKCKSGNEEIYDTFGTAMLCVASRIVGSAEYQFK